MIKFKKAITLMLSLAMLIQVSLGFSATKVVRAREFVDYASHTWEQDNPKNPITGQTTDIVKIPTNDGKAQVWRNFKSGLANNNGNNPAIYVDKSVTAFKDGEFDFTFKPLSEPTKTRFGFYFRYTSMSNAIFVGYDSSGWFWQIYDGKNNPYYTANPRVVPAPEANAEVNLKVSLAGDNMTVLVDGVDAFNGSVDISGIKNEGNLAVKLATFNRDLSEIQLKGGVEDIEKFTLTGRVVAKDSTTPIDGVTVTSNTGAKTTTTSNGEYQLETPKINQRLTFTKDGFENKVVSYTYSTNEQPLNVELIKEAVVGVETLVNEDMKVRLDNSFPRIIDYTMLKLDNKVFKGSNQLLKHITINGKEYAPKVEFTKDSATQATYVLSNDEGLSFRITVVVKIDKHTLEMKFAKVESLNEKNSDNDIVRTIDIPGHSLISVDTTQENPNFMGGRVVCNTVDASGDEKLYLTNAERAGTKAYTMAVISNNELSATLYTNTETNAYGNWNNTIREIVADGAKRIMSLRSAPWVYQKGLKYRPAVEEGILNALPLVRVAITGDANGDKQINWNDGAIVQRDINYDRLGGDVIADKVATRIAMNFGSQAQNPFLTTLDNVKKVYLNTDGLGQSILLKGYGSEGHDSGHLNYADIGKRIGGAEDMKFLLDEGEKYGAIFGIHVNASETYPESKYFEDARLAKNGGSWNYGWRWLDQGINIDPDYDMLHGRDNRFKDLAKALDRGDGTNGLDYIYVDVWGNGQNGDNGTWMSQQLSKEILANGWAVAGEWGHANAYTAILQHWAADWNYGGYKNQGINSKLIRFVQNHQRDSWVANNPAYSGAAMNPLLGGFDMTKDFEGWQGRNSYKDNIEKLFSVNLATKFAQHFEVNEWVDGRPTSLRHPETGRQISWTPEIKVGLINNDLSKKLVITRDEANASSHKYLSRTMTLDGKVVLKEGSNNVKYLLPWYWDANGKRLTDDNQKLYHYNSYTEQSTWELPDEFKDLANVVVYELTDTGKTNKEVVPVKNGSITLFAKARTPYVIYKGERTQEKVTWSEKAHIVDTGFNARNLDAWKQDGITADEAKIFDTETGTQVLEISNNAKTVKLSQTLTDLKAGQRYAVYVGVENRSDAKAFIELTDAKGQQIDYNYTNKSIALNYIKAYSHNTNRQSYTVNGTSYFQNMYVFFNAPEDGSKVTLTIGREPAKEATYFDDVRVVETTMNNKSADGKVFTQDFEDMPQGLYPFIIGGIDNVEDNHIHLSERHEPYTQRGWDIKKISEVIDGDWSVKRLGVDTDNTQKLIVQTIPQNYRFEPGKTYEVSIDYLTGTSDKYEFVVGDAPYDSKPNQFVGSYKLKETYSNKDIEKNTLKIEFTVPENSDGNYWIGFYNNGKASDTKNLAAYQKPAVLAGYYDLVFDNLKIVEKDAKTELNLNELNKVLEKADEELNKIKRYTQDTYNELKKATAKGKELLTNTIATQDYIDEAVKAIEKALENLEIYIASKVELQKSIDLANAIVKSDKYSEEAKTILNDPLASANKINEKFDANEDEIAEAKILLDQAIANAKRNDGFLVEKESKKALNHNRIEAIHASSEAPYDGNATKDKLVDGSVDTMWHNDWQKQNGMPQWVMLKFDKPVKLTDGNYIARRSNTNGMVRTYKIYTASEDTVDRSKWTEVKSGEFKHNGTQLNDRNYNAFDLTDVNTQYLIFEVTSSFGNPNDAFASGAELQFNYLEKEEIDSPTAPTLEVVDKSMLSELINLVEPVNRKLFAKESVEALDKAYEEAIKVIKNVDASKQDVQDASEKLSDAFDNLLIFAIGEFDLSGIVLKDETKALFKDKDVVVKNLYFHYQNSNDPVDISSPMEVSVNIDKTRNLAVYHLNADGSATQIKDITINGNKVSFVADKFSPYAFVTTKAAGKDQLQAEYKKAMVIERTQLTDQSRELLENTLNEVKELLADDNATQDAVDAMLAKLKAVVTNLKKKPNDPIVPDPNQEPTPNGDRPINPQSDNKLPNLGSGDMSGVLAFGTVALALILLVMAKKRKYN